MELAVDELFLRSFLAVEDTLQKINRILCHNLVALVHGSDGRIEVLTLIHEIEAGHDGAVHRKAVVRKGIAHGLGKLVVRTDERVGKLVAPADPRTELEHDRSDLPVGVEDIGFIEGDVVGAKGIAQSEQTVVGVFIFPRTGNKHDIAYVVLLNQVVAQLAHAGVVVDADIVKAGMLKADAENRDPRFLQLDDQLVDDIRKIQTRREHDRRVEGPQIRQVKDGGHALDLGFRHVIRGMTDEDIVVDRVFRRALGQARQIAADIFRVPAVDEHGDFLLDPCFLHDKYPLPYYQLYDLSKENAIRSGKIHRRFEKRVLRASENAKMP